MSSPIPLLKDPQKKQVQETLLQYEVPPKTARSAASVQLRNFSAEELSSIFRKLRRRGAELRTFDFAATTGLVFSMSNLLSGRRRKDSSWLKPPLELMERSAKENLALCVNALGEWSLRREGYFAISHVWQEGIQADPNSRGMPVAHVKQIFQKIGKTGAEWIWLDGLAIPGSSTALNLQEEELKIAIINNLASIYKQASAVIILDALVMQLQSTDPIDTAVCLLCGKWMTRLWTYQEIYLARKALILTASGVVDFMDMTRTLRALSCNDGDLSEILGESSPGTIPDGVKSVEKYYQLYVTFGRLLGSDGKKPSLSQIALSCRHRKTGNDIDYARAFFPVLGLSWKLYLTREEGMALIFAEQTYYAMRLVLMNGSPRLSLWPGWAPSYLTGLEGLPVWEDPVLGDIEWERRGLKRYWYTYKVEAQDTKLQHDNLHLVLSSEGSVRLPCVCETSQNERAQSLNSVQDAITKGSVYLLSQSILSIPSKDGLGYRVLLVERDDNSLDANEAWVYLTATVVLLQETIPAKPAPWLILHENPIPPSEFLPRGGHRSGKDLSTYVRKISDEPQFHRELNPFHIAAKEDDDYNLQQLLATNTNGFEARDEQGWAPLHIASFNGHVSSVKLLLDYGASVDIEDNYGRSPLMLAADEGRNDVVKELLQHGADVNLSGPNAECSLNKALRGGHFDTVQTLLAAGANPTDKDQYGFAPFAVASLKDVRFADLLISSGLDLYARYVGATVLHYSARAGNVPLITRLLELGMPVDLEETIDKKTALWRSIEIGEEKAVAMLLDHGANPNHMIDTTWTCFLYSVEIGNYNIVKNLLKYGVDAHTTCQPERWTALHIACRQGHRLIVKLLLMEGWEVDAKDSNEATPLQLAELFGHTAIVDILKQIDGSA